MDEVRIRDVPEHVVVTERRSVDQAELERWLPGAMARVAGLAGDNGGVAGTAAWPYLERTGRKDEPVFFVVYEGNPAYEKVERWIGEQGLRIAGPPREVFYTDYFDAADTDDVFDVAFPIA